MKQYRITDDLSPAKIGDWIEGVGYIDTSFQEQFIQRFAEAIRSRPASTICDKVSGGYECAGVKNSLNCPRDAAIRNALIDEFAKRFRSAYIFFDDVKFDETIESLRNGEQP